MRRLLGNTDIFNPVSQQILLAAGKLAGMNVGKTLLDLGCGKGFPSLLWASQFGVRVQGYDINESYVEYANARTKLLGLEEQVQYFCQDLQTFHCTAKSDVVASLGIELSWLGGRIQALNRFKEMLNPDSTLILAEPVWRQKPV